MIVNKPIPHGTFSPDHDLTYEEWYEAGRELAGWVQGYQWAIGDWVNYGTQKYDYGKCDEAVQELFGLKKQTLQHYSSVARTYEPCIRMQDLSFAHHQIAAPLPPEERMAILEEAKKEKLTKRQLSALMRSRGTGKDDEEEYDESILAAQLAHNAKMTLGKIERGDKGRRAALIEVLDYLIAQLGPGTVIKRAERAQRG